MLNCENAYHLVKQHILIVDDDIHLAKLLRIYLSNEGYDVTVFHLGQELLASTQTDPAQFQLIILDLVLPDSDGITLAREIRRLSDVPIIMLTGKDDSIDKIVGLEVGADDYVTKPFDQRELLARIRSVTRRSRPIPSRNDKTAYAENEATCQLSFDGWRLDLLKNTLFDPEGIEVELTSHEFQLLRIFAQHPNHVLSRDRILDLLSGRDHFPLDRSIDVLVAKVRKKLKLSNPSEEFIKTVRGTGYKFAANVTKVVNIS